MIKYRYAPVPDSLWSAVSHYHRLRLDLWLCTDDVLWFITIIQAHQEQPKRSHVIGRHKGELARMMQCQYVTKGERNG